jgi:hypothetical protein
MWLYSQEFNIEDYFGFVYIITNLETNKKYIGKKFFHHTKKLPPLKGMKRKRTVIKESDWQSYYGSSNILKEELKQHGKDKFKREIIKLCTNKKELTYWETKLQFAYGVLEKPDEWYNDNILGKFFTRDLASVD